MIDEQDCLSTGGLGVLPGIAFSFGVRQLTYSDCLYDSRRGVYLRWARKAFCLFTRLDTSEPFFEQTYPKFSKYLLLAAASDKKE